MSSRRGVHSKVVPLVPATPSPPLPAVVLGRVVEVAADGQPWVEYPGNTAGPVAARLLVALDPAALARAVAQATPTALVFEGGDPRLPLITGLLHPPGPVAEASVDGTRVAVTGAEEVTLRCGDASITLHKSGKLVVRGAYVETHATGTNRIKGASVKIN